MIHLDVSEVSAGLKGLTSVGLTMTALLAELNIYLETLSLLVGIGVGMSAIWWTVVRIKAHKKREINDGN